MKKYKSFSLWLWLNLEACTQVKERIALKKNGRTEKLFGYGTGRPRVLIQDKC